MAKNYTLKEAANIIAEGTNKIEIIDIGRRFPLLAVALTANIAKAGNDFLDFINYMPDYMTANKVNSLMKAGVYDTAESDEAEEAEEKPAKSEKKKGKKKEEAEETEEASYEDMSAMELFKECKKRGIKAEPKKPAKFYIDLLKKDDKAKSKSKAKVEEPEEDEDWEEEEEKPAKKAKEKVEKPAKKPAKKAEPEEEDEEDGDDWDI